MLKVKNLSFGYAEKPFLKNLSFEIGKGENVSIIGASGCGKSTLLQAIYGLHHVNGKIFWDDRQLLGPNFNLVPGEDFMKYLTQDFDLMPSLGVADNVGKYLSNMYPRKKQKRINELLDLVEMKEMARVKARLLSGGQQQRVALARVLANPPEVLLLDEPFSHIDHFQKNKLRRNLFSHLKSEGITTIIATHDSTDALSYADHTLVMKAGRIISRGTPEDLFNNPKNAYVASLFGEVNEVPAALFLPKTLPRQKIVLYPHEIRVVGKEGLQSTVRNSFFRGSHYLTEVILQGTELLLETAFHPQVGDDIYLKVSKELVEKRLHKD